MNQEQSQMVIQTTLMMHYTPTHAISMHVDKQNKLKLHELAPEEQHKVIKSVDKDKDKHTQLLDLRMPEDKWAG